MGSVWIAGGYQSDFARNYAREGLEISDMVAEAVEGNAALDLLRRSPSRFVVLLDYLMPGADGKWVLQVVSQDAVLSTAMSICCSLPADVFRCPQTW